MLLLFYSNKKRQAISQRAPNGCLLLVDFALPVKQNRTSVTVDANATSGALISSGIGKEATNVVAAPTTVPAKTIRASLFSDTSISSTKQNSPPRSVYKKNHFEIIQIHLLNCIGNGRFLMKETSTKACP
jgi:hypothetical protein